MPYIYRHGKIIQYLYIRKYRSVEYSIIVGNQCPLDGSNGETTIVFRIIIYKKYSGYRRIAFIYFIYMRKISINRIKYTLQKYNP